MLDEMYDVVIIGAGVVGCIIARSLSRYKLDVLLIEKEADVGMGASSANTAIVHAGYDPVPGSLKAVMNVAGNKMWDTLAGELNFPFERRGDYVVAIGEEELPKLDDLWEGGVKNGVPGMIMLSGDEVRRREPNINPEVSGALWASTGGICDPFAVVVAAAEKVTGKTIHTREAPRRAGDAAILVASSQLARQELGWKPEHADLEDIVASAWRWHQAHPDGYGT